MFCEDATGRQRWQDVICKPAPRIQDRQSHTGRWILNCCHLSNVLQMFSCLLCPLTHPGNVAKQSAPLVAQLLLVLVLKARGALRRHWRRGISLQGRRSCISLQGCSGLLCRDTGGRLHRRRLPAASAQHHCHCYMAALFRENQLRG